VLWRLDRREDAIETLQCAIDEEEEECLRDRRALTLAKWKQVTELSGESKDA